MLLVVTMIWPGGVRLAKIVKLSATFGDDLNAGCSLFLAVGNASPYALM